MQPTLISSRHNAHIKQIRHLFNRRERERTGLFFADGLRVVAEAIAAGAEIETLIVVPELLDKVKSKDADLIRRQKKIPTLHVTPDVLASIDPKEGGQEVAAVIRQRWEKRHPSHFAASRGQGSIRLAGFSLPDRPRVVLLRPWW